MRGFLFWLVCESRFPLGPLAPWVLGLGIRGTTTSDEGCTMKGFLTCLAALAWLGLVIYQMSPRRQLPRGCDIHGPEASCLCFWKTQASTPELYEAADRAHRGGWVQCPIHGPDCYRRREARRTGRSQTDEDLARDGDLRRRAVTNGSH